MITLTKRNKVGGSLGMVTLTKRNKVGGFTGGSQHSEPKDYGPLMDHTQLHEEGVWNFVEGLPPNIAL